MPKSNYLPTIMMDVSVGSLGVFLALFSIVCYLVRIRLAGGRGLLSSTRPRLLTTDGLPSSTRPRLLVTDGLPSTPTPLLEAVAVPRVRQSSGSARIADKFRVSVNPFTPTGIAILKNRKKRVTGSNEDDDDDQHLRITGPEDRDDCLSLGQCTPPDNKSPGTVHPSVVRRLVDSGKMTNVSIRELQTSRFNEEFRIDEYIATGSFGVIYKCTNLFDGIPYAIKKIKQTVHRSPEYLVRKEVYANSVFGRHPNLVSYFTAWYERGHIYIQTEFCHGGTLERMIHESDHAFCDNALRRLLWHVCNGLAHIHSKKLAHLDIKSANILVCKTNGSLVFANDLDDEEDEIVDKHIVYKIGDFGHTICVEDVRNIEDGDSRYLPKELLRDDYSQLQKVDVFSTALTVYEAATRKHLPKNGPEWHRLRNGEFSLPQTPFFSTSLEKLLKKMVDLDPTNRPSASKVVNILLDRGMAATINDLDEMEALKLSAQFLSPWLLDLKPSRTALSSRSNYIYTDCQF
ncbi:wee1-like protein kinase 2 [Metopolophium dirhodum]|uniref:wee1-like protein kinase 2 n=1 Tax=Metopolophium dirhodum TaxID=44670 RepID=UPI00298FEBD5|nr:wee1-like protein kinase 2 [Metopolophium dirhodum]